jgi:hypothetical protein
LVLPFEFVLPAGFAFALAVLVVVELVTVVELPLAAVLVVLVVFVVDVVFDVLEVLVVFVRLAVFAALLAGAASPQAIPRALRPRTVESTITFFILELVSCLLQKLSLPESLRKPSFFSRLCSSFKLYPSKR